MYFPKVAVHAILLGAAIAVPAVPARRSVLKERHLVPRGWTAVSRPSSSHTIDLEIGLKHQNQDKLEQHAKEVSNPSHARYGQYLSAAEVKKLITPSDESFDLVNSWLSDHGISTASLSPAEDSIWVRLPVSKVEELLDTTYSVFRHEDGTEFVRAPEWSLPEYLHEHIDIIQPTNSFFRAKKNTENAVMREIVTRNEPPPPWWNENQPAPGQPYTCDIPVVCNVTGTNLAGDLVAATTLTCLRCLYGTYNYTAQAANKNSIGIANYLNNTQVRSDIQEFLSLYRPEAASYAEQFPIISVNGGLDDQDPTAEDLVNQESLEGDLDGEMVLGISWPTPLTSWVTGGEPPFTPDLNEPTINNEPYLNWQQYVLAQSTVPNVISTSYGDDEQTVPYSYASRVCDNFKQLAARGVSVIFSSGDSGVGANGTCYSNTNPSQMEFIPSFPPSCPWVTTVGATKNYLPEEAVSRFGSGAGFSNYFPQPSYQTSTVEGYLAKIGNLYQGLYNQSGRAYPDVAAQGNHDVVVWGGNLTTIGGTSASAPTFAGVIALVNDALIAAGKPPLGFLNPWIYGGAYAAFTDITIGSSIGCNGSGFPATVGWDAVTGFGTPNFGALVSAAMQEQGQGWQSWN